VFKYALGAAPGGRRVRPELGMVVLAARVLHHGDESFTSPFGLGRARWAWFAPVDAPGQYPQVVVEVVPSSVAADLLRLVLGCPLLFHLASF
jgi:hypothetical protein